jgi:hypothetical protein
MELNPTLKTVLEGIGEYLEKMDTVELTTFDQQWQDLTDYVQQEDAQYNQFLDKLKGLIAASPSLLDEGFEDVLASVPRYRPNPKASTQPNPIQGLPPVHNEVVRIGAVIQKLLPNKTKP